MKGMAVSTPRYIRIYTHVCASDRSLVAYFSCFTCAVVRLDCRAVVVQRAPEHHLRQEARFGRGLEELLHFCLEEWQESRAIHVAHVEATGKIPLPVFRVLYSCFFLLFASSCFSLYAVVYRASHTVIYTAGVAYAFRRSRFHRLAFVYIGVGNASLVKRNMC